VVIIEAMKMEHVVTAGRAGTTERVLVEVGQTVNGGQPLLVLVADNRAVASETEDAAIDLDEIRPDLAEVLDRKDRTTDTRRATAVEKRHRQGHCTARENIADLCETGTFVEYGGLTLAAQRQRRSLDYLIDKTPADGLIGGIGLVDGHRAVVMSYDYMVMAGTQSVYNHDKMRRLFDIARQQNLPVVMLVEGGGGRPGDTDFSGIARLDEATFTGLAHLSGKVPLIAVVSGRCFAGNAALASISDVIIATEDASIGMGGPAMIEGGGLGVVSAEEVGPTSVQVPNGVIDVLVKDEAAAIATARTYLRFFTDRLQSDYDAGDQRLLRHAVPANRLRAYNIRDVINLVADTGSLLEIRPEFGVGILTALARVAGRTVGLIANNPTHLGGAIDAPAAEKAARFLQLCDAHRLPVLSLVDTPGFMVGPESEKTAGVRRFGRLFVVGANLRVPVVAVVLRKGYGLGAMAMTGGHLKAPLATLSWPSGEFGGMGLEGAVRLGYKAELAAIEDPRDATRSSPSLSPTSTSAEKHSTSPACTRSTTSSIRSRPGPSWPHSSRPPLRPSTNSVTAVAGSSTPGEYHETFTATTTSQRLLR
jgi:acetyl-CoA carboxylase carboxyltransferase component